MSAFSTASIMGLTPVPPVIINAGNLPVTPQSFGNFTLIFPGAPTAAAGIPLVLDTTVTASSDITLNALTGEVTVAQAGKYQITAYASLYSAVATPMTPTINIYINGAPSAIQFTSTTVPGLVFGTAQGSTIVTLPAATVLTIVPVDVASEVNNNGVNLTAYLVITGLPAHEILQEVEAITPRMERKETKVIVPRVVPKVRDQVAPIKPIITPQVVAKAAPPPYSRETRKATLATSPSAVSKPVAIPRDDTSTDGEYDFVPTTKK